MLVMQKRQSPTPLAGTPASVGDEAVVMVVEVPFVLLEAVHRRPPEGRQGVQRLHNHRR